MYYQKVPSGSQRNRMTHTSGVLQRTSTFRTTKKRYTDSYNNNSTVEYLTYSEIAWEISNVTPKVGVGAINWRYPKSVDSFLLKGLWFLCGCTMGEFRLISFHLRPGMGFGLDHVAICACRLIRYLVPFLHRPRVFLPFRLAQSRQLQHH